ncbi:ClpP family protease [Myceligenerans pegani]|uniref:ATP-dependent Clp protease proteolytic subunit n=1 Tax=Myceligenerans pegani TaxID=2776917 RepID=A0ABR9MTU7_9MICO|nr:ATP-dependent Clp protease proteolytic subunit [Myceligenerans sp. TRM 65318]MBE1874496.1 ATP-dependent Clp protease proteolytic subunit [Myceligenerans sp. TRM 65318]MBE3016767.1 ATP-dependent Clp protease proteolytic subunit [Myceligenerans sp. TRM 65318]
MTDSQTIPLDDHLAARLLHQRIVVIGHEIDDAVANRVTAQLLLLSAEDQDADIALYINSPGGSITAGMGVYDTMQLLPNDVATVALGFAGSMAQVLLTAGAAGKRYALPHARIMMHQPLGGIGGTVSDIMTQAENLKHTKQMVTQILADHTGQSPETIAADSDRDRWFTAEQAQAYGIVDKVVNRVGDVRPTGHGRRVGI